MGKKKAPMKRFTNGHKCMTFKESVALQEIYASEEVRRQNFYARVGEWKASRNVILGDRTSREDAPMLMPRENVPLAPGSEDFKILGEGKTLSATTYNNPAVDKKTQMRKSQMVNGFVTRRNGIEAELEQMKLMVRQKQLIMGMTYNGNVVSDMNLHPATEKIKIKNISNPYVGGN